MHRTGFFIKVNGPAGLEFLYGSTESLQALELGVFSGPMGANSIQVTMDQGGLHPEGAIADAILSKSHVAALSI